LICSVQSCRKNKNGGKKEGKTRKMVRIKEHRGGGDMDIGPPGSQFAALQLRKYFAIFRTEFLSRIGYSRPTTAKAHNAANIHQEARSWRDVVCTGKI